MKFFSTVFVASLAASAVAMPQRGNSCGGGQVVNCCNTGKNSQKLKTGPFGLFNIILAPGQCSPLSLPIVGALFNQNCGNNVAQCCNNAQGGIININLGQCIAFPF